MQIEWAALGQVLGVSLVVTVGLVGAFTLGIVGVSNKTDSAAGSVSRAPSAAARTGAYVCFALCAAAVAYGIYIIVK